MMRTWQTTLSTSLVEVEANLATRNERESSMLRRAAVGAVDPVCHRQLDKSINFFMLRPLQMSDGKQILYRLLLLSIF